MNDGFTMNGKLYDFLKWIALVLLPLLGSLYFGLGALWNVPAVEQVVGTITLVDTILGLLVKQTSANYAHKQVVGDIVMTQDPDGAPNGMRLVANRDPLVLEDQTQAVFNVKREQPLE